MSKTPDDIILLDTFWPYQAIVLADQISRYTSAAAKTEAGINLSQWRVLAAIAQRPGITSAEVAAITPMDKTIVSRAVSSLITAGLVSKTSEKDDKRKASLSATPLGRAVYDRIAIKLHKAFIEKVSSKDAPTEFTKMLKRYSENMKTKL